jgi:hypothetical protein
MNGMNNGQTLFILAGYRGSGKTYLLENALKNKTPLFGEKYDSLFQSTRFPCKNPEVKMSFDEAIQSKSWITWNHIIPLSEMTKPPHHLVLHLDFISFFLESKFRKQRTVPETISFLSKKQNVEEWMALLLNWLNRRLVKKYQSLVINTLVTPWEIIAERLKEREYAPSTVSYALFKASGSGKEIQDYFYEAWFEGVSVLNPDLLLETIFHGSIPTITEMT